jgi:hypothetical protein
MREALRKALDARRGFLPRGRGVDVPQETLRFWVHALRKLVEHIQHLVAPAVLVARLRIDVPNPCPQAERPIADEEADLR